MIKYRPHRGTLEEAMKLSKEFDSIDDMFLYIVDEWGRIGYGTLFEVGDLSLSESLGDDNRIGWKNCKYVLSKRIGEKTFEIPQCIGYCSVEI